MGPAPNGPFGAWSFLEGERMAETTGLPEALRKQIDTLAGEYLAQKGSVGLAVGVVYRGRPYTLGYGRVSPDSPEAPDADSLFEIASITKTFTATLLAEMAARGEVSLKDPLRKHMPEGVAVPDYRGREIDLVHLATHLSGLPGAPPNITWADDGDPWGKYTEAELYQAISQVRLRAAPGARGEYSNFGMGLLGNALGRVHGGGYEAAVVERICEPLGMQDTRIWLTPAQEARFVPGHTGGKPTPHWTTPALPGCGALRSTVRDMLRYLSGYLGDAPSPLKEAMEECRRSRGRSTPPRPRRQRALLALLLFAAWLAVHWQVAPPPGPASNNFYLLGVPVGIAAWFGGAGTATVTALLIAAAELFLWHTPLRGAAGMLIAGAVIGWLLGFGHRIAAKEEVGLGWFNSPLEVGKARFWWHNGMTGGFATFAGLVTESGAAVVLLSNANLSADLVAIRMLRAVHLAALEPEGKSDAA